MLIPAENEKDLVDIPAAVKEQLEIVPVSHVDEVLARAMTQPMQPIEWTEADEHAAEPPNSWSFVGRSRHLCGTDLYLCLESCLKEFGGRGRVSR